jgi:hypothetical protein
MSMSAGELRRALSDARQLPYGPARSAALDSVFRHADAAGEEKFAFDGRLDAIWDYSRGGDKAREFLAFSWCLATYDRQPEIADEYAAHHLLWVFKWIVAALPDFPDVPLERTYAVLDDMQRRYQLGGHSLHAVYQHRWVVAQAVGDDDGAEHWYAQMLHAPRGSLSDCRGCVPTDQVWYLARLGRNAEAVEAGTPALDATCAAQPKGILTAMLVPYLRTGMLDEAVRAHVTAYRQVRHERDNLAKCGEHALFCGLTGNEARGLEIVEQHLPWLDRPCTPHSELWFCSGAAQVLGRLCETGKGDLTLQRRTDDGSARWETTVAHTRDEMAARARELAARFDARNGNTATSERISRRIHTEPLVDSLPLTVLAGRGSASRADDPVAAKVRTVARLTAKGDTAGAARARLDAAVALAKADRWEDAVEAAEEAVRELDRCDLTLAALRCRYLLWKLYTDRRDDDAAGGVLAELLAHDAAAGALPPGLPSRAGLLEQAAERLGGPERVPRLLAAADGYRDEGRPVDELRALRQALEYSNLREVDLALVDRGDRLLADLPDGLDGVAAERGQYDSVVGQTWVVHGRVAEGLDRQAGGAATLRAAGLLDEWALASVDLAERQLDAGRADDAENTARELLARDDLRDEYVTYWAAVVVAKVLRRRGRHDEAAAVAAEYEVDGEDYLED